MNCSTENNKRIAKNTIMLYIRMILIMIITLYTSRVILYELGVEDYGIYNVVGGIIMMFSFINTCMSSSTQRFLTFELGRNNKSAVNDIFSASLNIHILIAIIVIIISESLGLFIINNYLNIPSERLFAANVVFQFSILTFCVNIIQVPYNATLIAHEKMSIYAYISVIEAILKLFTAYTISIIDNDKLIIYSILVFITQLLIRYLYQIYCRKNYEECRFRYFYQKELYKKLSSFAGWNLFGSIAWILKDQGINILLNIFFGPSINAARGIAMQVSSTVMNFISNFQVALNPQITKNYANGEIERMEDLVYSGIKLSFFLLLMLALPVCININYILNLWLKEVPQFTNCFIILILIDSLVSILFGGPIMTSLSSTGNIMKYQIVVSSILMMVLPTSYLVLLKENNVMMPFYIIILFTLISGITRYYFCVKQIGFNIRKYIRNVLYPIFTVTITTIPIIIYIKYYWYNNTSFVSFIILTILTIMISSISIWTFGIRTERVIIIQYIKNKFNKK